MHRSTEIRKHLETQSRRLQSPGYTGAPRGQHSTFKYEAPGNLASTLRIKTGAN